MHRILIVPDSLIADELGPSFLDRALFRVRGATSGREAIAIAAIWKPQLVLFASALPDMDAASFSQAIRSEIDAQMKLFLLADGSQPPQPQTKADARLLLPVTSDQVLLAMATLLEVPVRQSRRVPVQILARIEEVADDREAGYLMANILNLSENGVRLEAPSHLRVGATGRIYFALPDGGARLVLQIQVQVLIDELQLHYGVAFAGLTAGDAAVLHRFIEARLAPGAEG